MHAGQGGHRRFRHMHGHGHAVALRRVADPLVLQDAAAGQDVRMDHGNARAREESSARIPCSGLFRAKKEEGDYSPSPKVLIFLRLL